MYMYAGITNSLSLRLLPGDEGKHMPPPEPELNPHAQCPVCRFPPGFRRYVLLGLPGRRLPPPRICTPNGKAFRSLSTCSRSVERPSTQYSLTNWSVNFLPHARWAYFTKNVAVKNALKLTASICLLHVDDTPLEVYQNHAPPNAAASARESLPFCFPALPAQWAGYANPGPQPLPSPSVSRVLGQGG